MKKQKMRLLLSSVVLSAVLMVSCSKKMEPLTESLFNASPAPMELVGTTVPVTINGRFPADWFDKNADVTITPVLKYSGGEVLGKPQRYHGENISGNGIVINKKAGGTITLKESFNYVPAMKQSELFLKIKVTKKGKFVASFPEIKVADGVIATAALATAQSSTPAIAPDAFQRIIKETYEADIMFLIQRAELRASELNSGDINAWKNLIKEADADENKNLNVEVTAYASPDGGLKLNEGLAEQREKNTSQYLEKEFKKQSISSDINARYTAQDWEGFKKLVEASNLQDKNLVLSVLSMYTDPVEREREIKNISAVYSELAETILPKLRRSRLIANIEVVGKTDEEIRKAANGSELNLTVEELLYAASLDGVNKERMYSQATRSFPNDARAWNNLGAVQFEKGNFDEASKSFNRSKQLASRGPEANMNLALIELTKGRVSAAELLLGNAAGANTLGEAMGLINIQKGEYNKAVNAFGDTKSNNAAVAQILTKNYSHAQRTLDAVAKKDATTYYLAAIVAARTNNVSGVASNLKTAIEQGIPTVQVSTDAEFSRFLSNPEVQNLLRAY